ncbi:hypothetical protein AHAS_Ahas17G0142000 [Arachis hypogaea]
MQHESEDTRTIEHVEDNEEELSYLYEGRGVHGPDETGFDVTQTDPKYIPGLFIRPEPGPRLDETYALSGHDYTG